MRKSDFIHVPYAKSSHGEAEIAAVVETLRTSTQMGKQVQAMEAKVAQLFDKQFGIMVNSGSSANYLALEILDLPKGSEVLTPALTFSTTVAPIVKSGLVPAFVDVLPGTYNLDVSQLEAMLSPKTKALMIPNLIGNLPDWVKIRALADQYSLIVIEDSADTLGATLDSRSSGYFSDISTTSFYGSHIINCAGNGGMLCVNSSALAKKARLLRSWGRSSSLYAESETIENRLNTQIDHIDYDNKFVFEVLGYNLEPSEMGAAFGLVQLNNLKQNIQRRAEIFTAHQHYFSIFKEWLILPKQAASVHTAWLAYPLTIKDSAPFTRKELQIFLENRNIQTRTVFTGNILRQPGFKEIARCEIPGGYPRADEVMRGGILLACHQGMTEEMIDHLYTSFDIFFEKIFARQSTQAAMELTS